MSELKIFKHIDTFKLESGENLPGFHLAYQTFGKLNDNQDNVIWVIHALTANSDPTDWWPGVAGPGMAIDTEKYFLVCANCLGSHYGSSNPLDTDPRTNKPFYHDFPLISNRDVVKAFSLLRDHIGIHKVKFMLGPSLGGQQCLEWAIIEPDFIEKICLIGTNAFHSPWGIAFNESQRMAIEADSTWNNKDPNAGIEGMKVARSIALLSYRTAQGYNTTQSDKAEKLDDFRASSYQRYQGLKLARRFNAFSYWYLSKMMDSHNIGRGRAPVAEVLASIKAKTTVIGLNSDILFPLAEQEFLSKHIPHAKLEIMESPLGHDGFLTEAKQISDILKSALEN